MDGFIDNRDYVRRGLHNFRISYFFSYFFSDVTLARRTYGAPKSARSSATQLHNSQEEEEESMATRERIKRSMDRRNASNTA